MTDEKNPVRHGGLHGLLDDIQAAALAPLTAIPEIAESEPLRTAAERLQKSQQDLYQSLKDVYPTAILNPAERERFSTAITEAREVSEEAAEAARKARNELQEICVAATDFGISEQYVARLAGVSRTTIRTWREQRPDDESTETEPQNRAGDQPKEAPAGRTSPARTAPGPEAGMPEQED